MVLIKSMNYSGLFILFETTASKKQLWLYSFDGGDTFISYP
ncbi:hypothetical protein EB02_00574 [Enterococcus faecium]|nr:hypothetical protein EB02_00574 [Enterococcus faecium]